MPRNRREPTWREVRPGLLLMVAITAAAAVAFFLDDAERALRGGRPVILTAEAAPEVGPGTPVWVAGHRSGRVRHARLEEGRPGTAPRVVLVLELEESAARALRADARARIYRASLLGSMVVSLHPGSPDAPPLRPADTLRSRVATVDQDLAMALLDTLRTAVDEAAEPGRELARAAREGEGTLGAFRRDPGALDSLRRHLEALEHLLVEEPDRGSLGRLLAGPERPLSSLGRSVGRLEEAAAGRGDATARMREAGGGLMERLHRLSQRLERGEGSLARALADTAILQQRRLLQARMDSLRADVRSDPLRWLLLLF